jgi:N-acetylglucosamine-6-sulfatase
LYPHNHQVVVNEENIPDNVVFFPQYLQQVGYETALVGKWHMGSDTDHPQRGFDYWVSFKGQGSYFPEKNGLNVNGKHVEQKGYITDEITDYAIDFLTNRDKKKPFMLYMGHKGVHLPNTPAERHSGMFKEYEYEVPLSGLPGKHKGVPMWAQNRRNSRHGVEYPFLTTLEVAEYYKRYAETLYSVDESVGRILDYLKENGLQENTLVIFMSDNGAHFGDHGFVDKRSAYEESMKVPMVAYCPGLIKPGTVVKELVANIDIAGTVLEVAGLKAPAYMNGKSFLPLLQGKQVPWRDKIIYEYFWERNFPMTPTMHAIRTDQYKYIRYYGLWDSDELYDLQNDPLEVNNLIRSEAHAKIANQMSKDLFDELKSTNGMYIPLYPDKGNPTNVRYEYGSPAAEFPSYLKREK